MLTYDNAEDARNAEPREAVKGTWEGADECRNGKNACVEHEAEFAIRELGSVRLDSESMFSDF